MYVICIPCRSLSEISSWAYIGLALPTLYPCCLCTFGNSSCNAWGDFPLRIIVCHLHCKRLFPGKPSRGAGVITTREKSWLCFSLRRPRVSDSHLLHNTFLYDYSSIAYLKRPGMRTHKSAWSLWSYQAHIPDWWHFLYFCKWNPHICISVTLKQLHFTLCFKPH